MALADELRELAFEAPVGTLKVIDGVREHGLDEAHLQRLIESEGQWPPILVWEGRDIVLDGAHRLVAARRLGMATISAARFHGAADEAYVEAIRRNVTHGLPLTIKERTIAAGRVLLSCPEWSDRRISLVCGLSAKTVARLRREASSQGQLPGSEARIGRDGRSRPIDAGTMRQRIATAITEHPAGSLRAIATSVGASPETVRSVRRSLGQPRPRVFETVGEHSPEVLRFRPPHHDKGQWTKDPALSSCPSSECFLTWFESTEVTEEWADFVNDVPLSRVYEVADEARRRARAWQEFAQALEGGVRLKRASGVVT